MLQIDLILQMLQTPRDWFIISLEGIGMTVLNAIAEETDRRANAEKLWFGGKNGRVVRAVFRREARKRHLR